MNDEIKSRISELGVFGRELRRGILELNRIVGEDAESSERLRRARVLVEQAVAALEGGIEPASAALMVRLRSRLAQMVDHLTPSRRAGRAESELDTPDEAYDDEHYDDEPYDEELEEEAEPPAPISAIHGSGDAVSIPDLLGFLQVQGKTGQLEIDIPGERITLQVSRGDLVGARSDRSPVGSRLGEILVSMGVLERAVLHAFVVFHSRGQNPIGQALELHELVTKKELRVALIDQAHRIVQRLLDAKSAQFVFEETIEEPDDQDYRLSVIELLLESARQYDERTYKLDEPPAALPSVTAVDSPDERTPTP